MRESPATRSVTRRVSNEASQMATTTTNTSITSVDSVRVVAVRFIESEISSRNAACWVLTRSPNSATLASISLAVARAGA